MWGISDSTIWTGHPCLEQSRWYSSCSHDWSWGLETIRFHKDWVLLALFIATINISKAVLAEQSCCGKVLELFWWTPKQMASEPAHDDARSELCGYGDYKVSPMNISTKASFLWIFQRHWQFIVGCGCDLLSHLKTFPEDRWPSSMWLINTGSLTFTDNFTVGYIKLYPFVEDSQLVLVG